MGIGLPWDHPIVKAHLNVALVRDALQKMEEAMVDAGYDYTQHLMAPEDGIGSLVTELNRKSYDGVVIGFGVRGSPELTVFFEEMVNTIQEHAPKAKFLFNTNTSPLTAVDAARRWFPVSTE